MSESSAGDAPWLHGDGAKAVGSIEVVYQPHAQVLISLRVRIFLACVVPILGTIVLSALRYDSGYRLPPSLGGDVVFPYLAAVLLFVGAGVYFPFWWAWWRQAQRRLLVGERGFAEWTPDGETVLFWDEIGTEWRFAAPESRPWQYVPSVLALVNSRGERWELLAIYASDQDFIHRLSGQQLRQEVGMPASRPAEPRHKSLDPGDASPWLEAEEVWEIEPLERVCKLTGKSETWLNFKVGLANAAYVAVGLAIFIPLAVYSGAMKENQKPYSPETTAAVVLLIASMAYIGCGGFWANFAYSPAVTGNVRLVVGAGGILVWTEYRRWVVPWGDLAPAARLVAVSAPDQQERLLVRALWDQTNANNGNLYAAVLFTSGPWLVARYLDEMRLLGHLDVPDEAG